jgi:hypothetical protein
VEISNVCSIHGKQENSECHKCGRRGHWVRKCPYEDMDKSDEKKSDGLRGKKSKGPYKAFMVSSLKLSRWHWYIDSGCTTHDISEVMVHNLSTQNSNFTSYQLNMLIEVLCMPNLGRSLFLCYRSVQKNIWVIAH